MSNFKMYDKVMYYGQECVYVCEYGDDSSIIEVRELGFGIERPRCKHIPDDYKDSLSGHYLVVDRSALTLSKKEDPVKEQKEEKTFEGNVKYLQERIKSWHKEEDPETLERLVTSLQERIKSGYNKEQEEPKIFEKLYIKFEEGNQESLNRACREAERLGYERRSERESEGSKGNGLLQLSSGGDYFETCVDEPGLIRFGYKEHKIEEPIKEQEDECWKHIKPFELHIGGIVGAEHGNYGKLLGLEDEDIPKQIERRSDGELVRETKKEPCLQSPYLYLFS